MTWRTTQLCFVFVSCVHSRVVEGSWEGIAGCIVHVDMCMESVYVVGGCNVVAHEGMFLHWLGVVHGYEVSFVFQPNALLEKKLDVSTASVMFRLLFYGLYQSIHSMHKTLLWLLIMAYYRTP